jgi:hypothetical protein
MTERTDKLHHDNEPANFSALVQAFSAKHHITQFCQPPFQPRFGSLRLLAFQKLKSQLKKDETGFRDFQNGRILSGQPP